MRYDARAGQPFARISAGFLGVLRARDVGCVFLPMVAKEGLTGRIETIINRASPTTPVAGEAFQGGFVELLSDFEKFKRGAGQRKSN